MINVGQPIRDLGLLLSSKVVAVPLILLLLFKLYTLDNSSVFYAVTLVVLTCLGSMRWCIHLIAKNKLEFLGIYRSIQHQQKSR